jgi:hypothetical protein
MPLRRARRQKVDLTKYVEKHCFVFDEVFGEKATNEEARMRTRAAGVLLSGPVADLRTHVQTARQFLLQRGQGDMLRVRPNRCKAAASVS